MLIDRSQTKLHVAFAVPAAILLIACTAYYASESVDAGRAVGGGSKSGLLCGIVAGAIILFEMLLWPRKALRRLRLIPAKYWMAAHLWLGVVSLPLAIVHCGFHLGGWLPTTLMVLFVLAWISGVYGLVVQNILPRWMLSNLPAETIYSQIDYVSGRTVDDARQMLLAACGRSIKQQRQSVDEEPELVASTAIVVGALRQAGKTSGRTLQTKSVSDAREDAEALWAAFAEIEPFLLSGGHAKVPVADRQKASQWFSRLRSACSEQADAIIDSLEGMCDQRRQFDTQQTVHRWLHFWLPFHIGLSVAVTVLLGVHIWTALKYW